MTHDSKTLTRLLEEATPGPWKDYRDAYGDGLFVDVAPKVESDNLYVIAGQVHGAQRVANAELIAIAPDLAREVLTLRKRVEELEGDAA